MFVPERVKRLLYIDYVTPSKIAFNYCKTSAKKLNSFVLLSTERIQRKIFLK